MRIGAALVMVSLWGCGDKPIDPSKGTTSNNKQETKDIKNAKVMKDAKVTKIVIESPSDAELREVCKLLVSATTAEETGELYAKWADKMMIAGTAPDWVSAGMTASQYKALSPERREEELENYRQTGVSYMHEFCRS